MALLLLNICQPLLQFRHPGWERHYAESPQHPTAGVQNPIVWVDNGQRAIDWLQQQPLPGLVLLDLNLPGLDGLQVLDRIRGDGRTRELPVATLTTSDLPGEIRRCQELGCNRFLRKPIANDQFADTVASILQLLAESAAANKPSGAATGTSAEILNGTQLCIGGDP